jgi:hypothetical protein
MPRTEVGETQELIQNLKLTAPWALTERLVTLKAAMTGVWKTVSTGHGRWSRESDDLDERMIGD